MLQKEQRRRSELLALSNLGTLQMKTFANFNPEIQGARKAYQRAVDFVNRPQGWIIFIGTFGCGKTHLAAAIANDLYLRNNEVLFAVVPDLLDHLRSTFGPNSETSYDQRFEAIRSIQVLILDDLGTENATPWAKEKLFQLINHRYNSRLATVYTTNQDLDRMDPRIESRLCDHELCQHILIEAGDYRKGPAYRRAASLQPPHRTNHSGGR